MSPPYVTPLKKWLEKLVHTRFLTWMSPCIWGDADGYGGIRHFLHGTAIGRFIVDRFWAILGGDVMALNNYDAHPETAKLKPWVGAFWIGSGLSIFNYETDFLELVKRGNVKVHIADITRLSKGKVHLSSGEMLDTDVLLCSTGWRHMAPMKFLPAGLEAQLGLPHQQLPSRSSSTEAQQESLTSRADAEILSTYPRLKKQPETNRNIKSLSNTDAAIPNEDNLSPLNLFRFMVPADEELLAAHDIAFAGNLSTITTAIIAQTQGLWMTAYFDGKLSPLSPKLEVSASTTNDSKTTTGNVTDITSVQYSATLHNRFGKWRCPGGKGGKIPDFVFDALPYVDLLLGDLGLKTRRKGGGLREISEPYGPEDYVGVVGEWVKGLESAI